MLLRIFTTALLSMFHLSTIACAAYDHDPAAVEELRVRDGLPNFFQKATSTEEVRVAYLGGSITKAEGWRVKSLAWLQKKYPQARFKQIDAAVSGTGADFAACRLQRDVLNHDPDLVFVEFRVNGAGGFDERAIEGIVRQIWENDPETDICFVYTIGRWMINGLSEGKQTSFGATMERTANIYGIPSIDLSVEVIKQLEAETLEFQSPEPTTGKLWFSKDGVHPGDAGHELYNEIIARSLEEILKHGKTGPHTFPAETTPHSFQHATFLPITSAKRSSGWQVVERENDSIYQADTVRTRNMLQDAIKCSTQGESLTINWEGRLIGFSHIPQEKGLEIEISIDDKPPETFQLDPRDGTRFAARSFYAKEQPAGKHRATLTVKKLPPGTSYYAGQFLIPSP